MFAVHIWFNEACPFKAKRVIVLHNVTEVHYNYRPGMVAFESDVHGTGIVYETRHIAEFTVYPEAEIAEAF